MILAGVIVIAAGFGVALVKTLELPSYTIPFVIGLMGAVNIVSAIWPNSEHPDKSRKVQDKNPKTRMVSFIALTS